MLFLCVSVCVCVCVSHFLLEVEVGTMKLSLDIREGSGKESKMEKNGSRK